MAIFEISQKLQNIIMQYYYNHRYKLGKRFSILNLVGYTSGAVLSLRKRSDLNKELLTIEISVDEYYGTKFCS